MAKKADRPVAYSGGIGQYPRPSYFGLKGKFWDQVERYSNEIVDIRQRQGAVNRRRAELEQELNFQKSRYEEEAVLAARLGKDEPSDHGIKVTEKEIDKQKDKHDKLTRALQLVQKDIQDFMNQGVPTEVLNHLYDKGKEYEAAYQDHVAKAQEARDSLGQYYSLHMWASAGDQDNDRYYNRYRPAPLGDSGGNPWYEQPLNWTRVEDEDGDQ